MKKVSAGILAVAVAISLIVGGIGGFFLGIASTKLGKEFLEGLSKQEQMAAVEEPQKLVRERFELLYPANWSVNTDDEDYDADYMFSIASPGATFVLFMMGDVETDPQENIQNQITAYTKFLGNPTTARFCSYGKLTGEGVQLNGRVMGVKLTVKAFSFSKSGFTAIIVQQYPDDDLKYVEDGLALIERSFSLRM